MSSERVPSGLGRREFVKRTFAAAAAVTALRSLPSGAAPRPGMVDVNVTLSQWPLRSLPVRDTAELVTMLRERGVSQAWAGSFDGVLHKDLRSANARLAEQCHRHGRGLLLPFGSVNPKLPDWPEDLRRCAEEHRMPGLRLYPNYHGYTLDDPALASLLRMAAERRLLVQLVGLLEDERMMHPLLRVPPVNLAPLAAVVRATPGLRLVLLNVLGTLKGAPLRNLLASGEVYVEIAMLEGVGGVADLLEQVPLDRVLFGSHTPLFYFESAALKLRESALTSAQLAAIQAGNAQRLIGWAG